MRTNSRSDSKSCGHKRAYVTDEGYLYLSCIVEVIRVWAKLWVYRKEWIATNNSHIHTRNKVDI